MTTSKHLIWMILSILPITTVSQETVTLYYAAPTSYITLANAISRGLYDASGLVRNSTRYPSYVLDPYEDWRLPIERITWTNATHAVLFFDDGNVERTAPYFAFASPSSKRDQYERLATGGTFDFQKQFVDSAHANGVKVLLIIQAVNPSNLNYVTDDSARTQIFADAVIAYAKEKKFDGVSLNWEAWMGPINTDTTEIARLLRMLHDGLETMNPPGILELAPGPVDWNRYPRTAVNMYVDMIHLQEYAFTPGYDTRQSPPRATTWWECPIYNGTWDIANFSSVENWGPRQWVARGYDPRIMGVMFPALGRIFKGTDQVYGLHSLATSGNMVVGVDVTYFDRERFRLNGGRDTSDALTKGSAVIGTAATSQVGTFAGRNIEAGVKFFATFMDSTNVAEGVKWGRANNVFRFGMFSLTNDPAQRLHKDFLVQFDGTARPSPPFSPTQTAPANGATGVSRTPTLLWTPLGTTTKYWLQVSTNSSFSSYILNDSGLTTTSHALSALSYLTTYYWRVASGNSYGWSTFSPVRSFTTISNTPPNVPVPAAPSDGATDISPAPTLSWAAQVDATKFWLQVSSNPGFSLLLLSDSTLATSSITLDTLAYATTYYWRIAAGNVVGWSMMSPVFSFTTANAPPSAIIPDHITLYQNFPNPFNPTTTIPFFITEAQFVSIKLYNMLGEEIAALADEVFSAGYHSRVWDAQGMPSGVYYCRLLSKNMLETKMLVLVK